MKPDANTEDAAYGVPSIACDAWPYDDWARLYAAFARLGADERRVLLLQAERLVKGKPDYGELVLATDSRNFCREAAEEVLDMGQYLSILLLRWSDKAALKGGE